jgi:uncharacterized protein (DUF433 family)
MTELVAFTPFHVCRVTGFTSRQLTYWDRTGFFSPTILDDYRRRAFGRIYSFRDLVGLRLIAILRKKHHVPLQELRRVGQWLGERHEEPWSSLRFGLMGRSVVFFDPDGSVFVEPRGAGQEVMTIDVEPIANEMSAAADRLRQRERKQFGKVVRNRYVVHNAWVIEGTRIPTSAIWNFHEAGYSEKAIIGEYPGLTMTDVRAAIAFERKRSRAA